MTIYLPDEPMAFRDAFNNECERIIASKQDRVFYTKCAALIEALLEHPLIMSYLRAFEKATETMRREFSSAALKAFEEEWIMIWRMHPKNSPVRKELMRIKRQITCPRGFTFSPLFHQINFSLLHLRFLPSFCGLLKKISSFFQNSWIDTMRSLGRALRISRYKDTLRNRAIPCLASDKEERCVDCISIIAKNLPERSAGSLQNRCCHINEHLVSYKRMVLITRASIRGNDIFEKRTTMQAIAEIDPEFCWDRMKFLQKCWHFKEVSSQVNVINGAWVSVREAAWESAWEMQDQIVYLTAQKDLGACINAKPGKFMPSPVLNAEHQIYRKDYEGFLQSLKHHIHTHILRVQNTQTPPKSTSESDRLTKADRARMERQNFVIKHAEKYRTEFPHATHPAVFKSYKEVCPKNLRYGLTAWKKIIQASHLDRRDDAEKKKASGRPPKKQA